VALGRHPRHAAPDGVLRLHRSGNRTAGFIGYSLGDRRYKQLVDFKTGARAPAR
jgi:hypothetical protein